MSENTDSGGFIFKTGLFALLAGIAYFFFNKSPQANDPTKPTIEYPELPNPTPRPIEPGASTEPSKPTEATELPEALLPVSTTGDVVRHRWFALSYSEDHEQAEWVAYELTRARLNKNWAERPNTFRPDPAVRTESATPRDYNTSGYDKGHLCPAADMAFDAEAIDETFFMSNISPQIPAFNTGVWRELEELTRDWARQFKTLYVVTGPVLNKSDVAPIGFSKVTVPRAFYKVLVAPEQFKAIAFALPNAPSDRPVMDYAVTINQVERLTGIDFFPQLLKGLNEELEASLDKNAWPTNRQRERERVESWNKR